MRRVIAFLVIVVAIIMAVGFWRGWLQFSTEDEGQKTHISLTVDYEKINQDWERVRPGKQQAAPATQ
jgi:hypothetical protein